MYRQTHRQASRQTQSLRITGAIKKTKSERMCEREGGERQTETDIK